jgi:hypothetical protein
LKKHRPKSQKNPSTAQSRHDGPIAKPSVATPRNLTPGLCERLRREILHACKEVAEAHGLAVGEMEMSDIDLRHGFAMKFRVGIPMADGSIYSADKALFEVLAGHFGLEPSDYGKIFRVGGETFRITAINPNRPKYPVSAERVADSKGFKFTVENVLLYLRSPNVQ